MIAVFHPEAADAHAQALRAFLPDEEIVAVATGARLLVEAAHAEALLAWRPPAEAAQLPRLTFVQAMGAGVEAFLTIPFAPTVRLARMVGSFSRDISEYVLGHVLFLWKGGRRLALAQAARVWDPFVPRSFASARVGVAGFGAIGRELARAFVPLAGDVRAHSRTGNPDPALPEVRVFAGSAKAEFLADLDVLVLALPLTPATESFLDAESLGRLAPGALVVNVGRGALVDEEALLHALWSQQVGHAVLDVFRTEPLPASHPFWSVPSVTVTPHLAGPSDRESVARFFVANLERIRRGEEPLGLVDRSLGY